MLKVETFPVYPLGCNCTVLVDTETKEAIVIDPGGDEDKIAGVLQKYGAKLKSIIHTHAHFDHFMGTRKLVKCMEVKQDEVLPKSRLQGGNGATKRQEKSEESAKKEDVLHRSPALFRRPDICLHKEDYFLYANLALQCNLFGIPVNEEDVKTEEITRFIADDEFIAIGSQFKIEVMHTPGHSPGSVCFRLETPEKQFIFSGDTLFRESIGRTDLWGGDSAKIIQSIKNRIFTIKDAEIIPGHGEFSTVFHEKKYNPFLQ